MVLSVVTWRRLNKVWLVLHHEDIVLSYFVKYRSWNLIANRHVFLTQPEKKSDFSWSKELIKELIN